MSVLVVDGDNLQARGSLLRPQLGSIRPEEEKAFTALRCQLFHSLICPLHCNKCQGSRKKKDLVIFDPKGTLKIVLWDMMPFKLVDHYVLFRWTCCSIFTKKVFYHEDDGMRFIRNVSKDNRFMVTSRSTFKSDRTLRSSVDALNLPQNLNICLLNVLHFKLIPFVFLLIK